MDNCSQHKKFSQKKGEEAHRAILTEEQAIDILRSGLKSVELVKKYGIAASTITAIRQRITWKHLSNIPVTIATKRVNINVCYRCGVNFKATRNSIKYCSKLCIANKPKKEVKIQCKYCKTEFSPNRIGNDGRAQKYCNQTCFFKHRFGISDWRGTGYSYEGLHYHMRTLMPKQQTCTDCGKKKMLDLANISQEYKLDISDWEWLCRKCHIHKDGRIKNLHEKHKQWTTARSIQKKYQDSII